MTDQPAGHLQGCQFFGSTPVGEPENCPKCGALIQPAAASAPPVIPVGATAVRPDRRPMFALGAIGLVALVAVSAMAIGAVGSGGSGAKATSGPTRSGNHVYAGKFRLVGDQTGWQSMSIKSVLNSDAIDSYIYGATK